MEFAKMVEMMLTISASCDMAKSKIDDSCAHLHIVLDSMNNRIDDIDDDFYRNDALLVISRNEQMIGELDKIGEDITEVLNKIDGTANVIVYCVAKAIVDGELSADAQVNAVSELKKLNDDASEVNRSIDSEYSKTYSKMMEILEIDDRFIERHRRNLK